jgi:hypothetical protein
MKKRIGSTLYEVNCFFDPAATETAEEKLLRIIKNDLTSRQDRAILKIPQTSRVVVSVKTDERSSA